MPSTQASASAQVQDKKKKIEAYISERKKEMPNKSRETPQTSVSYLFSNDWGLQSVIDALKSQQIMPDHESENQIKI